VGAAGSEPFVERVSGTVRRRRCRPQTAGAAIRPRRDADMKAPDYWKSHHVTASEPDEIEHAMTVTPFVSDGERFELVHFPTAAGLRTS